MASQSLKNLPPHVIRELRRHVARRPKAQQIAAMKPDAGGEPNKNNRAVLYGCIAFTTLAASIPLAAHYWLGGLNKREEALTAAQVRRGAFLNSGTTDVGRDPDWDFERGEYKEDTGYATIKGQFLAMNDDDLNKHEDKLEAFAKGKGRNN